MQAEPIRCADRAMSLTFWAVAALMVASTGVDFLSRHETALRPVLRDFEILRIEPKYGSVLLSGRMLKVRGCRFRNLVAYVGDYRDPARERERLDVRFLDIAAAEDATRGEGLQHWGPWRVARPETVTGPDFWIRVTHQCNPIYETAGDYLVTDAASVFREADH